MIPHTISAMCLPPIGLRTAMIFGQSKNSWGHRDVSTTMIYRHVLDRDGHGVDSAEGRL